MNQVFPFGIHKVAFFKTSFDFLYGPTNEGCGQANGLAPVP